MSAATVMPDAMAVAASWKRELETRSETNWLIVDESWGAGAM